MNVDETDLISGVYEGGLKVWDCSLDLVQMVADEPQGIKGKKVLELGCGQGLPGIMALKYAEAEQVTL